MQREMSILLVFAIITFLEVYLYRVQFSGKSASPIRPYSIRKDLNPVTCAANPTLSERTEVTIYSCTSNYSTAEVLNPRITYKVNDTIQIRIIARDSRGVPRNSGGDYFRVKLYSKETESSSSIDVTNDLGNGTYLAELTLRWPGKVKVIATLIHPSEAVEILKRIRDIDPGRTVFLGRYSKRVNSKDIIEDVICLPKIIENKTLCNYTDERTGYPWFCVAPSKEPLSCEDWLSYMNNGPLSTKYTLGAISEDERAIFKIHKLPIKVLTPQFIVATKTSDWTLDLQTYQEALPSCLPGQHLQNKVPSGFYHHNIWYSDQCNIHRFSKESALECLTNKQINIYGDSTARMLYEHPLNSYAPDLVGSELEFQSQARSGPLTAKDAKRNISIHFKAHGFPLRPTTLTQRGPMDYIVNELDDLKVNDNSVVLFSVSQHFTTFPLSFYEQRMKDIKDAVRRLHARNPRTLVIIKSANTREHSTIFHQLQNSEWYIRSLDLSLRALFRDYPTVAFIDAWDMTTAQNFVSNVHPHRTVVKSILDQFLSFICPIT